MRTHLGCTGQVDLGRLSEETQRQLEKVDATWLEFVPETWSLVVRRVQPDDVPALREIAGELLEFLGLIPDAERANVPGGSLFYLDEQTGQHVRLRVWQGGFLTVAWARPDYSRAHWEPYQGQPVVAVFEPYQRLNGTVKLAARPGRAEEIRAVIENSEGLYAQGELEIRPEATRLRVTLRDVNANVVPLVTALRAAAEPASSLEGEINVSSFRPGDLEDYCRFVFRAGEVWLLRPSLWNDPAESEVTTAHRLERAA